MFHSLPKRHVSSSITYTTKKRLKGGTMPRTHGVTNLPPSSWTAVCLWSFQQLPISSPTLIPNPPISTSLTRLSRVPCPMPCWHLNVLFPPHFPYLLLQWLRQRKKVGDSGQMQLRWIDPPRPSAGQTFPRGSHVTLTHFRLWLVMDKHTFLPESNVQFKAKSGCGLVSWVP